MFEVQRRALTRMRLFLTIGIATLLVLRIRSNHIVPRRLSLFIQQHWYNNISQIYRLNECKYSKVRMEAAKKVFIIVSRRHRCNEVIKAVFGASAEARRNSSDGIAWTVPYNYNGWIDPRSRCPDDMYFDNASRTAYGLARVDLVCRKRGRIWKRSVQEKKKEHRAFTVTIYGSRGGPYTITIGVLLYAVFGLCFLVTNLAYVSGIYTVHNATLVPENNERERPKAIRSVRS
ncbi:putative integral membrane protein [Acanthocheilonema viteae]